MATGAQEEEGRGFAGLASLVSDVDIITSTIKSDDGGINSIETPKTGPSTEQKSEAVHQSAGQSFETSYQAAPDSSDNDKSLRIAAGILGIGVIAACALVATLPKRDLNKQPSHWAYANSPSTQSQGQQTQGASKVDLPAIKKPPEPQAPSRLEETMPPVGQDLVLSIDQIRYCLAENIRLDGARSAVNNYDSSQVERFNTMVGGLNSRCRQFRYSRGALESARQDVEPYRNKLLEEGLSRFVSGSTSRAQSKSSVIDSNQITSANSFPASPNQTKDASVSADSLNSPDLSAKKSTVPANAWVYGAQWYCNDGYRKDGDKCVSIFK